MKFHLAALGVVALLLGSGAAPASAQDSSMMVIANRVVAQVGKTPITQSMVEEELFQFPQQVRAGWTPEQLKAVRLSIVDTLVASELLFQEAVRDTSIHVTDAEVGERADATLKAKRAENPAPGQFDNELHQAGFKNADEFRQKLVEQTRRSFYVERFSQLLHQNGSIKPLNPTEREVRAYYDAQVAKGAFRTIPASVSFKQLVVAPKATPEATARARHLVDSLIVALRNGADFETVARKYSMDASREAGGDLHWQRRGAGTLLREFEDAAFALKQGTISDPVVTQFGIHIIQVKRTMTNEAWIFHILIIPDMDSLAANAAKAQAEAIRVALTKGASFDSIQRIVHDMNEARGTEGSPYPIDSLPPQYDPIKTLGVGDISPVIVLSANPPGNALQSKYAVIKITGKYPAGPFPYEAAREEIRTGLATQNGENAYLKLLRQRIYVNIHNQ